MKRKILMSISVAMAFLAFGVFAAGCAIYDTVDEKDLSRWIVKFTSDYPSDLKEGGVEYSLQTLKEMNRNDNDFTITLPYDLKYEEEAKLDREFTLEPKTEFYYVDDDGQKVLVDSLSTKKDYYFMRDILYKEDRFDGELHHCQRVWGIGKYQLDYVFGTTLNAVGMLENIFVAPFIKIIVKNTNLENKN